MRSDYGTSLLNAKEENDRDASEVRFVMSFGCELAKDGNMWCCLLGKDLMDGHATFHKSPHGAVQAMLRYLISGEDKN